MLTDDTRSALPVFPLPNLVLMPGEALPLHIFEPRYRAMLDAVLAGDRMLGMGTLADATGAIHDTLGVGRVMRVQKEDDGRSNIVLVHVATVRVEEECEQTEPFRRFKTVAVEERDADPLDLEACRAVLYQLAATTTGLTDEAVRITELTGMELVHAIARRLYQDPAGRLTYLRWTDARRAKEVCAELAQLMAVRPAVADA
jgi:hypothetical protein